MYEGHILLYPKSTSNTAEPALEYTKIKVYDYFSIQAKKTTEKSTGSGTDEAFVANSGSPRSLNRTMKSTTSSLGLVPALHLLHLGHDIGSIGKSTL